MLHRPRSLQGGPTVRRHETLLPSHVSLDKSMHWRSSERFWCYKVNGKLGGEGVSVTHLAPAGTRNQTGIGMIHAGRVCARRLIHVGMKNSAAFGQYMPNEEMNSELVPYLVATPRDSPDRYLDQGTPAQTATPHTSADCSSQPAPASRR